MPNVSRLQNIWIISGLVVAVVTLAKHAAWFTSDRGLICILLCCLIFGYMRWKLLGRQRVPETKGNLKKIRASDIQRIWRGIDENMVGQSQCIMAIMKIIKRNLGMVNSNRHLGSFLLAGPTGTGKTYLAQLMAEGFYGPDSLINLAMNQQGLRGSDVVEILLKGLKRNPYRVVLLDEIDKASQEVFSSIYHFMESGQIMDPQSGEWFHCPGLIIIATTNAGAEDVPAGWSQNTYALLDHIAAHSQIPKALLSRFEGIYYFGELSLEEVVQIALMQVRSYYTQHGVNVNYLCPEAILEIVKENQRFKSFGVRQLIQVVRHKSDPVISQARRNGWTQVDINSDQNGNFSLSGKKQTRMAS